MVLTTWDSNLLRQITSSLSLELPDGDGSADQVLMTNGSGVLSWNDKGRIIQQVNTQDGALATGTTTMPTDDTIPQNTEGDEYMTLAITPTNTNNKLKIDVVFTGAFSASTNFSMALFQDSTADALAAVMADSQANRGQCLKLTHYMTAGTVSSTTFKIRAGGAAAGTTTFNGDLGARNFGGVSASSITITEYEV
jgi:hypothetical protein